MTSAASTAGPRPPRVFAPLLRLARILWRILPYVAFVGIVVAGDFQQDVDRRGVTRLSKRTEGHQADLFGAAVGRFDDVASLLFPAVDHVILTRSAVPRSVKPETLAHIVDHHHDSVEQAPSVPSALGRAGERAGRDDLVVVAGSIFLVGEARDLLMPERSE